MKCFHPLTLKDRRVVPCGSCIGCRINKTSGWTLRLLAEQQNWSTASFVTLTYDDDHVPLNSYNMGTLVKKDLQNFFKRLRKDLDLEGRKIKYYACGEYGDKTQRPHYHCIIFGLSQNQHDRNLLVDNWRFCNPQKFLVPAYKGCCGVTKDDIQYVCGYCQKKLTGKEGILAYEHTAREPPFSLSSQGLGLDYFKQHECWDSDTLTVHLWNGRHIALPKYFKDKFNLKTDKTAYRLKQVKELGITDKDTARKLIFKGLIDEDYRSMQEEDLENQLVNYFARKTIKRG